MPDFLLISLFAKDALEENCKFVNQTLHYSNEFNNIIVCHHKLSFHITITLFLFKTPTMFCKCVILPLKDWNRYVKGWTKLGKKQGRYSFLKIRLGWKLLTTPHSFCTQKFMTFFLLPFPLLLWSYLVCHVEYILACHILISVWTGNLPIMSLTLHPLCHHAGLVLMFVPSLTFLSYFCIAFARYRWRQPASILRRRSRRPMPRRHEAGGAGWEKKTRHPQQMEWRRCE